MCTSKNLLSHFSPSPSVASLPLFSSRSRLRPSTLQHTPTLSTRSQTPCPPGVLHTRVSICTFLCMVDPATVAKKDNGGSKRSFLCFVCGHLSPQLCMIHTYLRALECYVKRKKKAQPPPLLFWCIHVHPDLSMPTARLMILTCLRGPISSSIVSVPARRRGNPARCRGMESAFPFPHPPMPPPATCNALTHAGSRVP